MPYVLDAILLLMIIMVMVAFYVQIYFDRNQNEVNISLDITDNKEDDSKEFTAFSDIDK